MRRDLAGFAAWMAALAPLGAAGTEPPPVRRSSEVERPSPATEERPVRRPETDEPTKPPEKGTDPAPAPAPEPPERRRALEELPGPTPRELEVREIMKEMTVVLDRTCRIPHYPAAEKRLFGLTNQSQLMDLETWGDAENYKPGQKVFFFFRSPRPAYVTLFWVGPEGSVVVPVENIRIPGQRNVRLFTGGIVVPPLGRERWVAVNTLEPIRVPCLGTEAQVMAMIDRILRIPHGVGRWEVNSAP